MNQPTTVWPRLQRGLGWAAAISGIAALYIGLVGSPSEQFLGDLVRILYVHAGAAWVAYLAFGVTALASLVFLWRRQRAWDRLGLASAEIGVVLASLTLGSGMIWGRAAQGWWWRWEDPRLVLTLFMWFLYVAYLILRQFTEGERRSAVEHCKRYAHPNVLRCGRDVQVLPYLQSCLFFTALPRPEVEHPSREACEAYSRHVGDVTSVLQTRTMGMAPAAPTARQQDRDLRTCLEDFTPEEVECGTEAGSQLALFSCFSPYHSEHSRWVTAEECEVYGDHMMSVISSYLMAPYPKPVAADLALQQSGLAVYAQPALQRFQLVNLCHTLDRELMECHAKAATAADLAQCVP